MWLCLIVVSFHGARADLRIAQWPREAQQGAGSTSYGKCSLATEQGTYVPECLFRAWYGGEPVWPNTTLPRNRSCRGGGPNTLHKPSGYQCLIGPTSRGTSRITKEKMQYRWVEPSTFDYQGLGNFAERGKPFLREYDAFESDNRAGQKFKNYDQFLRSNIDNEQDNRHFVQEDGHDHLPFRTWGSEIKARNYRSSNRLPTLWATVEPGDSRILPLYWNNPHSSELEINIWIQQHSAGKPIVVPIRRPTCSGEGYKPNVIKFTIPTDFGDLGSKIPGFQGCNEDSEPMCVVQVYAHSVESRTYSSAFPIVIPGHKAGTASSTSAIEAARKDPWLDLTPLRELCRPSNDPEADIKHAVPRWARLVSDVHNHAYQNSDFSPYSGQQQESISQNLQAAAINKMVTGNRGELGATILTAETRGRIKQLQALEDRIYKNYEALANKIINNLGNQMKTTAVFDTTRPERGEKIQEGVIDGNLRVVNEYCFRCAEVGSMTTSRDPTNTYIPSFQLATGLVAQARSMVPPKYGDLITSTGQVRIYVQSLLDLLPFFAVSHPYGIIYQQAMTKNTLRTKPDATKFKKIDATGKNDGGVYASMRAKEEIAKTVGCPMTCLMSGLDAKPLFVKSRGTTLTGDCLACKAFITTFPHEPTFQPVITTLASDIVKNGLSEGIEGVSDHIDPDGSPRIGRPRGKNETAIDLPQQPNWKKEVKKEVPQGTTPPPTPVPSPPAARRRRRGSSPGRGWSRLSMCIKLCPKDPVQFQACVMKCLNKPPQASRRRRRNGARRRRRRSSDPVGLQQLFDEVAAQSKLT